MKWPLNHSMQFTQEQAGKKPFLTLLFAIIMLIVNIIFISILSAFLLVPSLLKAGGELSDQEALVQMGTDWMETPLASYLNLFLTAVMIGIVLLLAKGFQGRRMNSFAFFKEKLWQQYCKGALLAVGMMLVIYLANLIMGAITTQWNPQADGLAILLLLIGFMIQGMSEEVLLRGYLMNGLSPAWGVGGAIVVNSLLFSLLHYFNPGISLVALVNIFLAGIFFSVLFYVTDNLWLTGAAHSFWNFFMGAILGVQVSGLTLPSTLLITQSNDEFSLLNGGDFGFEGGIITTLVLLLAISYLMIKVKTGLQKHTQSSLKAFEQSKSV